MRASQTNPRRSALVVAIGVALVAVTVVGCSLVGDDDGSGEQATINSSAGSDPGAEDTGDDEAGSQIDVEGGDARSDLERQVSDALSELEAESRGDDTVVVLPEQVLFEFDEHVLLPEASATLDDMVEVLTYFEEAPVQVTGHTDSAGDDGYNQTLSERRAQAVTDYFVDAGVDAGRITTSGLGESQPVASNDDPAGQAENRRVEIVIEGVDPTALDQ